MPQRPGYISPSVVRRAMDARGLTVAKLAARTGVSAVTVRSWLGGRSAPTAVRLAALADVLDIDVRDITGVRADKATLADLRIHAGLTQGQAAVKLGTARSSLSDYELGISELPDALLDLMATVYSVPKREVETAWQRTRDTLGGM